jgi:hypothetical protein
MRGARASGWALACALAACAAPTAEEPKNAEAPAAEAAAPLSPERQRLERWKEDAAVGDPRAGFAQAAEAEAERRRSEALARGVAPQPGALEAEMRGQQLEELTTWESGCFAEEPDFAVQDDWTRHRTLTRADFRETEPSDVKAEIEGPVSGEAYVALRLSCVVRPRLLESPSGGWVAELESVRFFALLSREESWWNPQARTNAEWILRHEQLHFDIAELFAAEQNANVERLRDETRAQRPDPDAAAYALRRGLADYLAEQQRAFEEVERRYDRETRHGQDVERQTEWFGRVKRGLGAVRKP